MTNEKLVRERPKVHFETIPQLKLGFSAISLTEVDIVNKYIDDNMHRLPDLSPQLVGQVKQAKESKQVEFNTNDAIPKQLGKFFIECAKEYVAEHPISDGIRKIIGPKEEYVIKSMWSIHYYAGDYNPIHEHGTITGRGLVMLTYLKLPQQIKEIAENMKNEGNIASQHGNSGSTDGLTQFIWGGNSVHDIPKFKHPSFAYAHPEVGKVVIFPIWLLHQVAPFFGEGERRTMACNIEIINSHE